MTGAVFHRHPQHGWWRLHQCWPVVCGWCSQCLPESTSMLRSVAQAWNVLSPCLGLSYTLVSALSAQKAHLPELYTPLFRQWLYTILRMFLPAQIAGRTKEMIARRTCQERALLQLTHHCVGHVSPHLHILSMALTRINSVFRSSAHEG